MMVGMMIRATNQQGYGVKECKSEEIMALRMIMMMFGMLMLRLRKLKRWMEWKSVGHYVRGCCSLH